MNKNLIFVISLFLGLFAKNVFAQNTSNISTVLNDKTSNVTSAVSNVELDKQHPKRDFRAAFLTTIGNLDWPYRYTVGTSASNAKEQKQTLKKGYLNVYKNNNINAVMFQVRPAADAFYKSSIEPWSKYVSGRQGSAPAYDPLEFIVDECHELGIELHAWVNPFRVSSYGDRNNLATNNVYNTHRDWTMVDKKSEKIWLNPGKPGVEEYLVSVIEEIITNYDVDGLHFDDYFYPYEGIANSEDDDLYKAYLEDHFLNSSNFSKDDWRRHNISSLMAAVHKKVQEVNAKKNSNIIFGASPFGIWKNGTPVPGMDAYNTIYGDPIQWLKDGSVDYLAPQLYWETGGAQDYVLLSKWWNDEVSAYNRYLMPSQALYRMTEKHYMWPVDEIINQVKTNRSEGYDNTLGQIMFRSYDIRKNTKGLSDELQKGVYKYPSVSPSYNWLEQIAPNAPTNLTSEGNVLNWDAPTTATDGDTARRYLVYRFSSAEEMISERHNGTKVIELTGKTSYTVPDYWASLDQDQVFAVSAIDKNNNESIFSNSTIVEKLPEYCSAKGLNSANEWINTVYVGGVKNESGNNNGYGGFTGKVFGISLSGNTGIALSPEFKTVKNNQHWKIFIDYNNNGDFSDAGEEVFATETPTSNVVFGTIKNKLSLDIDAARMRIIMKATDGANDIDACTDVAYGEVEDYIANFVNENLTVDNIETNNVDVLVYPNPFNKEFNVKINSDKPENIQVVAYDLMGQVVYNRNFGSIKGENKFLINSSSWSSGVYMLLVINENKHKKVFELLKN